MSAVALIVLGCQPATSDWPRVNPPVAAPDFTLPTLSGGSVHLADYQGHVVVMEFWATWCGPCRFSTPSLEATYRKFRHRGVMILLINAGESPDRVRAWAAHRFTAPILLDQGGSVQRLYHLEGIPRLFVVDQAGQIVYDKHGYRGGVEHNLNLLLTDLLAHPASHGG